MLLSQSIFAQEPEFLAYENKDFGFNIQYPSDWNTNANIAVSFAKQNESQINSEADFYIRTEESFSETKTIVGNRPTSKIFVI